MQLECTAFPLGSIRFNAKEKTMNEDHTDKPVEKPVDKPADKTSAKPAPKTLTDPVWKANTAYAVGATVQPSPANGHSYVCSTAGTSGPTQPTFLTTKAVTVSDGSVVWTERTAK
jgi:hypothetical protein